MNTIELAEFLEGHAARAATSLTCNESKFIRAAAELRRLSLIESDRNTLKEKVETSLTWTNGFPGCGWCDEWFFAVLDDGSFAALKSLPDDYSYDFKTCDETYLMSYKIKKWMPNPDSEFLTPSEFYEKQIKELKQKIDEMNSYISGHGISEVAK